MPLSKPTNGSNADYAARIGLLFDAFNNGNYAFPATQVPSADANTLDDYEEGTFTATLGGTATYTSQSGRYTKIGRMVSIQLFLAVNLIGTGSTGTISGLPFTALANQGAHVGSFDSLAGNFVFLSALIVGSTTTALMTTLAAAGASMGNAAVFGNSSSVYLASNYYV